MSCNSPSLERFLQDHVSNIQELLIEATATVKSAAKRVSMTSSLVTMTTGDHILYIVEDEMYSSFCASCDPTEYRILVQNNS